MPTIRDVLADARRRVAPVSASVSLDIQLLLAEVLGVDRAHVIAHPERELSPQQAQHYESLISRREQGEPIAYLLRRRAFYDREFAVSPAVLIPRPETEHLLERALEIAKGWIDTSALRAGTSVRPYTVVDCGTGSGALAVTFKANLPDAVVYATDISPDALAIARENARLQNTDVLFFEGDLLQPLIDRTIEVDLVMANLPYIATDEMHALAVSKHEPHLALDGGADGLDLIRRLLQQAPDACRTGASLLLEIGADQGLAMQQLAQGWSVKVMQDYAGLDRVVEIRLP